MQQTSNILNKPIISIYESLLQGEIVNISFSNNLDRILGLIVKGNSELVEELFFLPYKKVYSVGNNVVTIKNAKMLESLTVLQDKYIGNCPINTCAYSVEGNYIANISDICFDKLSGKTITVMLSDGTKTDITRLVSFSTQNAILNVTNAIYKNTPPKKPSIRIPITDNQHTAEILQTKADSLPVQQQPTTHLFPQSILANTSCIIGKRTKLDINLPDFKLKRGTLITNETIERANRVGATKKLAVSCLTNIEDFYY